MLGGGAMAFVAFLGEDGADAGLEEFELLRGGGGQLADGEEAKKEEAVHARSL